MQNVQTKEVYNFVREKFIRTTENTQKIKNVFVFELFIYFFVSLSSNFVIQQRLDTVSDRRF